MWREKGKRRGSVVEREEEEENMKNNKEAREYEGEEIWLMTWGNGKLKRKERRSENGGMRRKEGGSGNGGMKMSE